MSTHYASGNWHVAVGEDGAFIDRWQDFLAWSRDEHDGLEGARLLRSTHDPRHFISFAVWSSADARESWKASDGFRKRFSACRELCDDFSGGDFEAVVEI